MKKNKKKLPRYWLGTMRPTSTGYQQARGLGDATFKTEQPLENLGAAVKIANSQQLPLAIQKASTNIINPALQYSKYLNRYSPQNYNSNPGIDYAKYGIIDTAATSIGSGATGAVSAAPTMAAARGLGQTKATLDAMRSAAGIGQSSAAGATSSAPWIEGLATTGPLANATPNAIGSTASITTNAAEQVGEKTAEKVATSGAGKLGDMMLGKILPAVGTVYGVGTVASDIVNSKIPGVTQQQLRDSSPTNIYTTSGGNTYKEYAGVDSRNALELERIAKRQKQVGLAIDAAGLGMSAGALAGTLGAFGSVLGPWGSVIGLGAGALLGGLASAIGFGDNEDKVRQMIKDQQDVFALQNWQSEATAKDRDVKQAFAEERGAKLGKNTGASKYVAHIASGETFGEKDPETGQILWMGRVPGKPSTKDNKLVKAGSLEARAAQSPTGFIITNNKTKEFEQSTGFKRPSDMAAAGLVDQALAWQSKIQDNKMKHKNNKIPGYSIGTNRTVDYLSMIAPRIAELAIAQRNINEDSKSTTFAPDVYYENPMGIKAVNELAQLRFEASPYYKEAIRGLNQANYETRRNVGIGPGGRVAVQNANFAAFLKGLENITKMGNETNAGYRNAYAQALLNLGQTDQARRMEAATKRHNWLQQANAAKFNAYRDDLSMIPQILVAGAKDLFDISKAHSADDYRNATQAMYKQSLENDKLQIQKNIEDQIANRQLAAKMFKAQQENENKQSIATPMYFPTQYNPYNFGVGNYLLMSPQQRSFMINPFNINYRLPS